MRHPIRQLTGTLLAAGWALALLGAPAVAQARVETLVWEHASPGEVAGFEVHYGTSSGSYTEVVDVGRPAQASDGSFSHDLSVADDLTVYLAVSAYADDGRTSPLSNERVREGSATGGGSDDTGSGGSTDPGSGGTDDGGSTDPGSGGTDDGGSTDPGSGGTDDGGSTDSGSGGSTDSGGSSDPIGSDPDTLWYEDFETHAIGTFVPEWMDTGELGSLVEDDALFAVLSQSGDRVLGTASDATNIHSHFVGGDSDVWSHYEVRARMYVTDSTSRIGITAHSRYPSSDAYYSLSTAWQSGEFEIHGHPNPWLDNGGISCSQKKTGVVAQPDRWYRGRLQVEIGGTATELRAKVWRDGEAEPAGWQATCSVTNADLPLAGTVGVSASRSGIKLWDDFEVIALPTDAPASPDPGAGALSPPSRPVLILE